MEIEVTVQNQNEFDESIQRYIESGYELESRVGDTAILRKKGFKLWIFIVLLLFLIIGAVLYYFLSDDNVVVIRNRGGEVEDVSARMIDDNAINV